MRLRKFHVRAYRCIHDSGEINVGDLAAFIGRNESGKTTILQALTLLNKDSTLSELDLCDEMYDELKEEIRIVEGEFELGDNEISLIKENFPKLPEMQTIKIYRTNMSSTVEYDFGDYKIGKTERRSANAWESFKATVFGFLDSIPDHTRVQLDTDLFDTAILPEREAFEQQMISFDRKLQSVALEEPQIIGEWEKIRDSLEGRYENLVSGTSDRQVLERFIEDNIHPRFVYFSDYKKIYGNINLNEYLIESKGGKREGIEYVEEFDKAETVRNLFYLAEVDVEEMQRLHTSPSRLIKFLNSASNKLTERLNPVWRGDPIRVDLRYQPGNIMSVVISDVHKDGTVTNTGLLNRRAEGFKWTFSFIVNFAAETQRAELKEAILLLDEPARNLHPTQQMGITDLLQSLAGSNQVLYATHSPYMIFDYTPGNLLVVELDKKRHLSHIFYDYWNASDKTLVPILYGLSRGSVQAITNSTLGPISRPVIIVETMTDSMYLNAFDKLIQDPNISMNPLNIVPAFNKNSVLPLAILYRNHRYSTFVLLDNSDESKEISAKLVANGFSKVQIIFFEKDDKPIPAIEDYMVPEDYIHAINQTYGVKLMGEGYTNLTEEDVERGSHQGIIDNLKEVWAAHKKDEWGSFDREEIARYICSRTSLDETEFLSDITRESYRHLYRLIMERIRLYKEMPQDSDRPGIAEYRYGVRRDR